MIRTRLRLTFILLRGVGLTPLRPPVPPPPISASSLAIRLRRCDADESRTPDLEPVPRRNRSSDPEKTREFTSRTRGRASGPISLVSDRRLDHDSISRVIPTNRSLDFLRDGSPLAAREYILSHERAAWQGCENFPSINISIYIRDERSYAFMTLRAE